MYTVEHTSNVASDLSKLPSYLSVFLLRIFDDLEGAISQFPH